FWRDGAAHQATVTLATRPGGHADKPAAAAGLEGPIGCRVEALPDEGVRVTSVDVRGPAWRAGLREGDVVVEVQGEERDNPLAFARAMSRRPAGAVTRLYVTRAGRPLFIGVAR